MVSAVAIGAAAGAVRVFGTDRVWQCLSQTLPRMLGRPLGRVMNAARAAGTYLSSFFHRGSSASRSQGGIASMVTAALFSRGGRGSGSTSQKNQKRR